MKTLLLLVLLLGAGFAFWKYGDTASLPDSIRNHSSDSSHSIRYTVQKNDTLHSISQKHDTTVPSIKELNNLSDNTIHVGDILVIKSKEHASPHPIKSTPPETAKSASAPKQQQPAAKPVITAPRPISRKNLPKSAVMENAQIAIDVDAQNKVYLKKPNGKFIQAGSIIYGSDADANGYEVKTITFRDLAGKNTTLTGDASPEAVIRLALKKQR